MQKHPGETSGAPRREAGRFLNVRTLGLIAGLAAVAVILLLFAGIFSTNSPDDRPQAIGVGTSGSDECGGGRSFYVAPDGTAAGTGTLDAPLDLTSALSDKSPAEPCDTIWLLGGTYQGTYTATVSGKPGGPITVRSRVGERVTIDSAPSKDPAIILNGNHVWLRDFEITNSDSRRTSAQADAWPADMPRGTGVVTRGGDLKLINLVIHDLARGIEVADNPLGATPGGPPEIYGNLIYNNGFDGPQVSVGNGIETRNAGAPQVIADNIIFNQYSHGILALGSSGTNVNNFMFLGNVLFNNGLPGHSGLARDLLVGGAEPALNPVLRDNATYGGAQTYIGHGNGCSNAVITENYLVGSTPLLLEKCPASVKGNVLYGQYGVDALQRQFPENTYHSVRPTGVVVRYRRNAYEPGRAHVIVFNWDKQAAVSADLAQAGLKSGDEYAIRDAQDYYGKPLVGGTLTGNTTVPVPMEGLSAAPPVGRPGTLPHTAPDFAVFVVQKLPARTTTRR